MATANLTAARRAESGKGAARALRRTGRIPAVIYGHARDPESLSLDARELGRLLEHVSASTVIELSIDGASARTLIREIQRHPFKRHVLHVDFQELVAGEHVEVAVPLVYVGIPEGVRVAGGILDQIMHELTVSADPSNIPDHIDVDVTKLTIGHPLHVSDLVLPAGVTVVDDAELTVAVVTPPRTAEAAAEVAEGQPEPELIRKPKAEGEGE